VPVVVLVWWIARLAYQPVPAPGALQRSTPAPGLLASGRVLELPEALPSLNPGVVALS